MQFSSWAHARNKLFDQVLYGVPATFWVNASDSVDNGVSIPFQSEPKLSSLIHTYRQIKERERCYR